MAATVTVTGQFAGTLAGQPFGPQSAEFTATTTSDTPVSGPVGFEGFDVYELTSLSATSPIGQNLFTFDLTNSPILFYTGGPFSLFGFARGTGDNLFSYGPFFALGTDATATFTVDGGQRVLIDSVTAASAVITASVPEPATWAMMIGGVGMAGGVLRRRKTKASVRFA